MKLWILASRRARVELRGRLSRANHVGGANTSPWVVLREYLSNYLEVGVPVKLFPLADMNITTLYLIRRALQV